MSLAVVQAYRSRKFPSLISISGCRWSAVLQVWLPRSRDRPATALCNHEPARQCQVFSWQSINRTFRDPPHSFMMLNRSKSGTSCCNATQRMSSAYVPKGNHRFGSRAVLRIDQNHVRARRTSNIYTLVERLAELIWINCAASRRPFRSARSASAGLAAPRRPASALTISAAVRLALMSVVTLTSTPGS